MSEREDRNLEWLMIRKSAALGDLIDAEEVAMRCGVKREYVHKWTKRGIVYEIEVPAPIFIPYRRKPLWLRREMEPFIKKFNARSNVTLSKRKRRFDERGI